MVGGLLRAGSLPEHLAVVEVIAPRRDVLTAMFPGVAVLDEIPRCDGAVLAVKPNDAAAAAGLAAAAGAQRILSIAAGISVAALQFAAGDRVAVIRSIPNTPASVGRGITVATANPSVTARQKAMCDALLSAIGEVAWVDDEALIDPVTAVSGSGPAYVFYLAECLAEAGVKAGLEPELAAKLARWTVAGAGELLHRSDLAAGVLRQNVTSPNGTTYAALQVLMSEKGLQPLMTEAILAATKRSRELAG